MDGSEGDKILDVLMVLSLLHLYMGVGSSMAWMGCRTGLDWIGLGWVGLGWVGNCVVELQRDVVWCGVCRAMSVVWGGNWWCIMYHFVIGGVESSGLTEIVTIWESIKMFIQ